MAAADGYHKTTCRLKRGGADAIDDRNEGRYDNRSWRMVLSSTAGAETAAAQRNACWHGASGGCLDNVAVVAITVSMLWQQPEHLNINNLVLTRACFVTAWRGRKWRVWRHFICVVRWRRCYAAYVETRMARDCSLRRLRRHDKHLSMTAISSVDGATRQHKLALVIYGDWSAVR